MHGQQPNPKSSGVPFLQPKQTQALKDEDAFMQRHGGSSARRIYRIVNLLADLLSRKNST
jgi:hypothetical protein